MQIIMIPTPEGVESVYDTIILSHLELLKERVTPLIESFSSLPITASLTERMLPALRTAWELGTANSTVYIEVTQKRLTGAGLSVDLTELSAMPPLLSPMDCWGFALALAEEVRRGMPDPSAAAVCPQYMENALNLAVENPRITVGLRLAAHM